MTTSRIIFKGRRRRLWDEELAAFCGELAVLMGSGLDLVEAMATFAEGEPQGFVKTGVESALAAVRQGMPFSTAMAESGLELPQLVIETLRVGEVSGRLVPVLERLERHYERRSRQKNKLIQILIYPAIVLLMTLGVTRYLVKQVLPSLTATLSSLNLSMTAGTRVMIALNGAVANVLLAAAGVFGALWLLHLVLPESAALRRQIDYGFLHWPFLGRMRRLELWAAYLDMLVLALESGVDLVTSLSVAAKPAANAYFKAQLSLLPEAAGQGWALSESLDATGLMDKGGVRLILVGEKAGQLTAMLKKAGMRYRKQYDRRFARLSAVMEPLLIIIVGILVGCIIVSFISLLYTIYGGYAALM
ncbi:type II secretion system F family protein [Pseudoramibacter sp.]|jgi:type II secretory pathway component PulF|uniref:type II secretion system F family protein n=1 Tax=Pseudoramibacter sp. TaxID=2034862 RepID=UPI0025EEDEAF|nr:type II secretion system F family protein [Pseudoramibacter sp.]MCH4071983.1 type II secretion system F family protein [Pseudoramibacter sp.]MCH4105752.1 type II secretion system F family protein [Pseudoramibacter sp.]